jgi:two-component system, cell cycle sensor histidine kinase and response regulator CckA
VHPDDRAALAEALRPVLAGEQEYCQQQARYLTSAGAVRWVDVHARAPRRPHDRTADGAAARSAGAAGTLTDVTERTQLEEQLRQAQKMEAVGRLAGGVAHDFNNLLTAIKGYGGLLMEALHPSDVRRADVQEINKAADRAAALTRQLLAFSRKQVLKPVVLDLNDVVADMESMLRRLIGEDVRLATGLSSDLGAVRADRGQLEQVLMNLVINARDAMPGGGALTVETANVDVRRRFVDRQLSVDPGHYVMLAVRDTGCGMDEETQQHIFEPFFTTKGVGGTGLGLATVYGIVRQSGGFVRVESAPGVGTTIAVHLPRTADAPATGERVPSPAPPLAGRGTVLLCEDESAVRALARRVLEGQGYTVIEAAHGAAALAVAAAHAAEITLLVTDVVMPEMGGRELAEQLTAARPGLRVLYMSGYTDGDILRRGLAREGRAFLQKPFTPEDLARKVQAVLTASPASHVSG